MALDCVTHGLLLVKLFYGVALMQNYLSKSLLDKAGSLGIDPFLQYFMND